MHKGKILYIDENQENLKSLEALFLKKGYIFSICSNPDKALAIAEETLPELILIDINFSNNIGTELIDIINHTPALNQPPIIVITDLEEEETQVAAFAKGVSDYIIRPFQILPLFARIENNIKSYRLMRMRERFLFGLNHDLKSPLSIVIGMNEFLRNGEIDEEARNGIYDNIAVSSQKMLSLIENFLDIGRLNQSKMILNKKTIDLSRIVNEEIVIYKISANQKNVKLDYITKSAPVFVDPSLMRRVISNLLSNAIKFTPKNGIIDISLMKDHNNMIFSIKDSGPGIPEHEQDSIFNMYYQSENEDRNQTGGTGIGLAIVKEIINAHNGKVWVNSSIGEGCEFLVSLPIIGDLE